MLEVTKSGIKFAAQPSKLVHNACVTISFASPANQFVLDAVRHGSPLYSTAHLHESVALHAAVCGMHYKLTGRLQDAIKNRVVHVRLAANGDHATVSIVCSPGKSVIRRVVRAALAGLNPARHYSEYTAACRRIGETPDRAFFDHAADALARAAKTPHVFISGRFNMDREFLGIIADTAADVLNPESPSGTKSRPQVQRAQAAALDLPHAKHADSIAAFAARMHVMSALHAHAHVSAGHVYFESTPARVEAACDPDRADKYGSVIEKIAGKDDGIMAYQAALHAAVSAGALARDADKTLTRAAVVAAVRALGK